MQIRPPDPGVPQTFASLESFDLKAVILHVATPGFAGAEGNMRPSNRM
jgi:hypothetical protein